MTGAKHIGFDTGCSPVHALAGAPTSDTLLRGSSLGTVAAIATYAKITMNRLNNNAMPAANRISILLVFPRNTSDSSGTSVESLLRSAVNRAAEIATPKAEPREEAIL